MMRLKCVCERVREFLRKRVLVAAPPTHRRAAHAGFTVAHDVSARDYQLKKNGGQWLLGKAFDGFAPIGPAIVTPDEIGDPHNLRLRTIVNGVVLQDGNTKELVHKTEALVSYISRFVTLKPGDLILTGCVRVCVCVCVCAGAVPITAPCTLQCRAGMMLVAVVALTLSCCDIITTFRNLSTTQFLLYFVVLPCAILLAAPRRAWAASASHLPSG
jgi:hypothetical protein